MLQNSGPYLSRGNLPRRLPPPLASLDTPPSLQPSLSHQCHPGKAHLGRVIHITVKCHLFLFHQEKKKKGSGICLLSFDQLVALLGF